MGRTKNKYSELKRRAILDAAMEEFETKGPGKASLRAIAAKAETTTGSIYSMFGGKEDLYAALLLESLNRLEAYITKEVASAREPLEAVRASVLAFFNYYKDRLFEVQLGMHSFEGFKYSSLGKERDETLNKALLKTLDIIGSTISEANTNLSETQVKKERDAIFSSLLGALSLAHTGRARSINTTPEAIVKTHIQALLGRIESS